jgi:phosphoribosylaminoimidazole-succinocarboxamide synthase
MISPVVLETALPGIPVRRGKVRDVYDLGDRLLLVSSDRISAFDWVLPSGIPDKGRVLTQLSKFWFA